MATTEFAYGRPSGRRRTRTLSQRKALKDSPFIPKKYTHIAIRAQGCSRRKHWHGEAFLGVSRSGRTGLRRHRPPTERSHRRNRERTVRPLSAARLVRQRHCASIAGIVIPPRRPQMRRTAPRPAPCSFWSQHAAANRRHHRNPPPNPRPAPSFPPPRTPVGATDTAAARRLREQSGGTALHRQDGRASTASTASNCTTCSPRPSA